MYQISNIIFEEISVYVRSIKISVLPPVTSFSNILLGMASFKSSPTVVGII